MFSLEQLLFAVASDVRTNCETLFSILPMITEVYEREVTERNEIKVNWSSMNALPRNLTVHCVTGCGCDSQ